MSAIDANTPFKALLIEAVDDDRYERHIVERRLGDLPDHPVTIRVRYSSLNYKDSLSAFGHRGVTKDYPHTPGVDAAGEVVASDDPNWQPGAAVVVCGYDLGMNTSGGLGQYIRVPGDWVAPLPAGMSAQEAMAWGSAGFTAALCVERLQALGARPEDGDVAVTGATGGVGSFAVALLAQQGYTVEAITGKLEKSDWLARLGARRVIDRDQLQSWQDKPLAKARWAHGVDTVGGEFLFGLLKAIQYGGSVTACGNAASPYFEANVFPFILRAVNLLGIDCVALPIARKAALWETLAGPWRLANLEELVQEISLDQTPDFLTRLHNGHAIGRYRVRLD